MNNSQIKRLKVNSITLANWFLLKLGQTLITLFIGGNREIVRPESSFARIDVYFFVQDSTILFLWSVAALVQYTFVENFTLHC